MYATKSSNRGKAMVKNQNERLTQPDRIAIVFERTGERSEIVKHIEFLQAKKHLLKDMELLDLEDLPGVRGLKALRVGINLEDKSLAPPAANIQTVV